MNLEKKFNEVFKFQEKIRSIFWNMTEKGTVNLNENEDFYKSHTSYKIKFDELKDLIINSEEKSYLYLNYGSISTTKDYIIIDKDNSILSTKKNQTLYKFHFGLR